MDAKEYLVGTIQQIFPGIGQPALEEMYIFFLELKEWNKKFNLTSITDDKEIIIKHFIDSLYVLKINVVPPCETALDIGSGPGFPGIPLALAVQGTKFTLIEPNQKKAGFLRELINKLQLSNVDLIIDRAEILSRERDLREKFDCSLSRALAKFPVALELSIGFIKPYGKIINYISQKQKKEIINSKALKTLKCEIESISDYSLPDNMGEHSIIIVKKLWKTNNEYPRQYNKIQKNPL
jgi:16S rRNA (guanine527-N7)-methyltransferase